jgi:NAD(P)-dependent dehydrogenase (short-subunit alcohol dehydrogenase family)
VTPADPSALLRPGLLDGSALMFACAGSVEQEAESRPGLLTGVAARAPEALEALGARVARCRLDAGGELGLDEAAAQEKQIEAAVAESLAELDGTPGTLIVDGSAMFGPHGGRASLVRCLQACWTLTRALVAAAFLPAGEGRIVLVGPADGAEHSRPAVAGLENLARTLSIEWARHAITTVAIAPGAEPAAGELAALLAYLASPAGSYFSGCLMDLRGPQGSATVLARPPSVDVAR